MVIVSPKEITNSKNCLTFYESLCRIALDSLNVWWCGKVWMLHPNVGQLFLEGLCLACWGWNDPFMSEILSSCFVFHHIPCHVLSQADLDKKVFHIYPCFILSLTFIHILIFLYRKAWISVIVMPMPTFLGKPKLILFNLRATTQCFYPKTRVFLVI